MANVLFKMSNVLLDVETLWGLCLRLHLKAKNASGVWEDLWSATGDLRGENRSPKDIRIFFLGDVIKQI